MSYCIEILNPVYKRLLAVILCVSAVVAAYAADIRGTVVDADGEPMIQATVRLMKAGKDSTFVKGAVTDIDGNFRLTGISQGKYVLSVTYIGYETRNSDVSMAGKNINLGKLQMKASSVMLKEAVVKAIKTPIVVKEDTVEFNADSYKTQPNAVIEDLLKRLPGVEVDTDGKITANGKEVTKILVDGKEFFADDPKVASKNLPVNMVDKLQVVDRKSDLARLTGVDDGEDETVINLTVKQGMKNGWFGTVEAGYGTDDRYLTTFNVNRFWDGNQLTFIGNANNTNQLGFTDGNGDRFRRFGGDRGINDSQQFGVNFNVGREEILRVGGDVMYSHTDRNTVMLQNRQYLLEEDSYFSNSQSYARDRGNNLRADFRVEWKPDSFNTLDFRPNISYNANDSRSNEFSLTEGKNISLNDAMSPGRSFEAGGRLIYNYNFASHRGRSFSVMANYRLSNVRETPTTYSYYKYLYDITDPDNTDDTYVDPIEAYEQYTLSKTLSNNVTARLSWTEPLGDVKNGNFLTVAYRVQYRWNNADKMVYQSDVDRFYDDDTNRWMYTVLGDSYMVPYPETFGDETLMDALSSRYRYRYLNQDIRAGFRKVTKTVNLDAGVSLVPQMSRGDELTGSKASIPERWVWNYAPYVRFRYKHSKTTSMEVWYNGRSSQPTMTQLQPVMDTSDPMNKVQGNPDLDPSFSHDVRLRYQTFDAESQRSIMTMFDMSVVQNSIVSRTEYDLTTGGRTTYYQNVNGVWNGRLMNMFSQPLRNKAWTFNNNLFVTFNQNVGFTSTPSLNNGQPLRNTSRSLMVAESFSMAFRPDNLEIELRPFYRLQKTFNTVTSTSNGNLLVHSYGAMANATYYAPLGLVLASDLNFSATSGYSAGYDTRQWMWNASLGYQFLRDKSATISIKAYDLLRQRKSINRTVTANYIDDTSYNTLSRYFMATFIYKFNTFGKGNQPESRGRDRGPGSGPGGRPGGRPGGGFGGGRPH